MRIKKGGKMRQKKDDERLRVKAKKKTKNYERNK